MVLTALVHGDHGRTGSSHGGFSPVTLALDREWPNAPHDHASFRDHPSGGFRQDDRIVPRLAGRLALVRVFELGGSGVTEIRQFTLAYTLIGLQHFARSDEIVLLDVYVARTRHAPFWPADAALRDRLNASFR